MSMRPSLQRKLIALVAAAIGAATLVSTCIGLWQQSMSYAVLRRQALVSTAQVFAAAAAQATARQSEEGAFTSLRGMAQVPDIYYAEIRTTAGRSLAGFGAVARLVEDLSLTGDEDISLARLIQSGTIEVSVPILEGGERVGQFTLIGGISGLRTQLVATASFTILGGILALLIGSLVAWRFQRRITRPLHTLLDAMTQVREEQRYDVVVQEAKDEEIGKLVDGFNRMLGDVRDRDARLAAHASNLEEQVRARTVDLSIARDAAEDANRAKSDFLATMSHEIRTPMNGIMVMAELLAQGNLPRRQQRFADVIAKSGKNLLAIINDILDFSKIEAGKLELERLPVDINVLAENVTSLFAERAREKGLDLAALIDPSMPLLITSDPVRLGQIVSNLVNNALKFTERGFVSLTIKVLPRLECLRIAVSDTGIGIAEDKLGAIFESFSQADHSTTRNFGGTGLGLTISQRLAHALGGEIKVESTFGKGSTFFLDLPIENAGDGYSWPTLGLGNSGVAVCVIDVDGSATRSALTRYFSASGYTVLERDVLLTVEHYATATVVCADIDKIAAYGALRAVDSPRLIAVYAQGDSRSDEIVAANKAAASLSKPLLRSEIEDVLKRLCAGEQNLQPVASGQGAAPLVTLQPFRVLVADDNAVNREVALEALSQLNGTVVTVENGLEAIESAAANVFDIIFMDGSMPVMDGFEAARRIRATEGEGSRRVPIVALTAHVVGTAAEEWRTAGMDDIVHKPFTVAKLAQTIERLLPHLAMGEQNVKPEARPPAPQHGDSGSVLDAAMLGQLRQMETLGNSGFVKKILALYVEHAPPAVAQIRDAADRADAAECARAAHALKSMSYNVGATPISSLTAEIEALAKMHGRTPTDAILSDLDRTLLQTLEAIGQQPEFRDTEIFAPVTTSSKADNTLEYALARAVERNELSLKYQPIVDRTGVLTTGVEALLRWQFNGQPVSPGVFIPVAEKTGSIHEIGEWVLRQACLDARAWPGLDLSVNVSAVQFAAPNLAERIERIVEETRFDWKRLQLEITETALLTAEDQVFQVMKRLRGKGASFSLDDFGTGYSSLTYLRRFPFDRIKIDQSFIADISLTVNASIVHAVTSIGRSLGLKLVAEGVESTDQRRFLTAAGIHYMQGYLFGYPVTPDEISDRLFEEQQMIKLENRK